MSNAGPFKPLPVLVDLSRTDAGRVDDMGGGVFDNSFFVNVTNPGELVVQLAFAVTFFEKPCFTFGGELGNNQPTLNGMFPTISMIVRNWSVTRNLGAANTRMYSGCSLLVVTTGVADQSMIGHASFVGQGSWNPT